MLLERFLTLCVTVWQTHITLGNVLLQFSCHPWPLEAIACSPDACLDADVGCMSNCHEFPSEWGWYDQLLSFKHEVILYRKLISYVEVWIEALVDSWSAVGPATLYHCRSFPRVGSSADACLIWCHRSALTGSKTLWSISSSSCRNSVTFTSGRKALLRVSARNISCPFLYFISKLYFWRRSSIRWRRCGAEFRALRTIASKGLWSDSTVTTSLP